MAPALSLCSTQGQTARHNSQALTMDPSGYHVAGPDDPAFFSEKCKKKYGNSVKYLNVTSLFLHMQDGENESGEYYSLNSKIWNLLEINRKSDKRGRIHVNETNINKEIRVFVSDVDQEPETCKTYFLLAHSVFTEVRKSRIKEQIGEPLKVQSSGDVWMGSGNGNKFVKVFVRIDKT